MAVRETVALIGLAGLGGTWAVAWGNRRLGRPHRTAMLDARTQFQVLLDAVRARTAILSRRQDLSPVARARVDSAVMQQVLIDSTLARAASADDVYGLLPELDECLAALADAARECDLVMPADQPFAGLCSSDPQHGAATTTLADDRPACQECADAEGAGAPRPVRLVARDGRPVAFDQIVPAPTASPG